MVFLSIRSPRWQRLRYDGRSEAWPPEARLGTMPARSKPMKRRAKPIPAMSEKRRGQLPERSRVRADVRRRAGDLCEAVGLPGVPHDHRPTERLGAAGEAHELRGGAMRPSTFLDPAEIVWVCRAVNQWVSNGSPREAERVGLRVPFGLGADAVAEAERLREAWRKGEQSSPSWWPTIERTS